MMRAIASYEIAENIFSEDIYPGEWANIQLRLGNVVASHGLIEGIQTQKEDLQAATHYFQEAHRVFRTLGDEEKEKICEDALARIQEKSGT